MVKNKIENLENLYTEALRAKIIEIFGDDVLEASQEYHSKQYSLLEASELKELVEQEFCCTREDYFEFLTEIGDTIPEHTFY
jgi:hypothetical protein